MSDCIFKILILVNHINEAQRARQLLGQIDCQVTVRVGLAHVGAGAASGRADFDVVVACYSLIAQDRVDGMRKLRAVPGDAPVIILADEQDEGQAILTLHEGAQDYIVADAIEQNTLQRLLQCAIYRQRAACRRRRHVHLHSHGAPLRTTTLRQLRPAEDRTRTFTENVSHEWRTPLAVITEYSSLLNDGAAGDVTDDQRDMLSTIRDRADDLSHMVADLLVAGQIDQESLTLKRSVCDCLLYTSPSPRD